MINTNDDVTDAPERNSIVIVREKVTEIEERQNRKTEQKIREEIEIKANLSVKQPTERITKRENNQKRMIKRENDQKRE